MKKRFIEETFPVKEVSEISAKEKNIRHGHISTLHIWWARRPLASSRATSYAALIPAAETEKEKEEKRKFIIELSKWENSLNKDIIEKARKEILEANGGKPPRILDPFAGGGAIPLEALRLGCETHAIDYNPVATLILKCTLEYPQKYGKPVKKPNPGDFLSDEEQEVNPLLEDVKKWGNWVLEEAKKEIGKFYPPEEDGSIPVGYIWARTIPCQNPACNAEIPLMRQFWLAKKKNKKVALYPYVEGKEVKFKIVEDGYEPFPENFDPSKGTVERAIVTCPVCGHVIDANTTRRLFQEGKAGQRMVAVVLYKPGEKGKRYRLATEKDLEVFKKAEKYLKEKRQKLMEEWGIDPVPDEPLPYDPRNVWITPYFSPTHQIHGNLFNPRQKLALITFVEKVRAVYRKMMEEDYNAEYAKAVLSYLGISINNLAEKNNNISRWANTKETIAGSFSRQALPMVWDYFEANSFSGSTGDWFNSIEYNRNVLYHLSQIPSSPTSQITQSSATELSYPDNYFDAVFTDPPYYDNVNYSVLSDFFYVWLKRSLGELYPELFSTPLAPKTKEIVADPIRQGSRQKAKEFFEENLKKAFNEIYRVLKPGGIVTIVYAHKSTSAWETLINSLIDSGLIPTASWPIDTEMKSKVKAIGTASLMSSIYFVCRKMERQETGWFNEVKDEIKKHIYSKLDALWNEGISGADYFISAIGSAIEIFGKYKKIMDYEGNIVRADRLIDYIRDIVTEYAVRQILHNGISAHLSPLSKFYLLWRWTYGEAKAHFDDARKLAQSTGIDLGKEWNKGFIKKEKEFIRVLGPQDRRLSDFEEASEMIDVLHKVLLLWKEGRRSEMIGVLNSTGWGTKEAFFKVAQAISETLSNESKEKKLLDGFLSGRDRILRDIEEERKKQGRLFE